MRPLLARSVLALCVAALVAGFSPPRARAQPLDLGTMDTHGLLPTGCPSAQTVRAQRREAARLFAEGERASSALRVAPAARAFACSYALVPTAQAAFNAGVAFEGLDDAPRARAWFARYLEQAPDADDRDEVAQRIAALDAREAAARAERAEEARRIAREAPAQPLVPPRARSARPRRARAERAPQALGTIEWVAIGTGGTGAAALVTGLVVFAVGDGVHADFVAGGRMDAALARRGEALDVTASTLWIGGLTLALAGAALGVYALFGGGAEHAPATPALTAWLAPRTDGGGELALAGVF